jgi:hypothetical protein
MSELVELREQREAVSSLRYVLIEAEEDHSPACGALARALHRESVELERGLHALPAAEREALMEGEQEDFERVLSLAFTGLRIRYGTPTLAG